MGKRGRYTMTWNGINSTGKPSSYMNKTSGGSGNESRNANNSIFPYTPNRVKQDIQNWRDVLREVETGILPFRNKLQLMYEDTMLNDHVFSCIDRRRKLTMLRQFVIRDKKTEKVNEKATELFRKSWFAQTVLMHILDARAYGYNLISLGDIVDSVFINPTIIKRTHVSPERKTVSMFEGSPTGVEWDIAPYKNWHLFVGTPTENGFTTCGIGYLYQVSFLAILLKNNWSWNGDFVQKFGTPIRELKTMKTDPTERKQAQIDLENMGSCAYMITDNLDTFVLHQVQNGGNGYKSYNDFSFRAEAAISKLILGHADALDSVPGKTGSSELVNTGSRTNDGDAITPVAKAMRDIQTSDGTFVESIVNDLLIPKMKELGFSFKVNDEFIFLNDAEEREIKALEADKNQKLATLALTLAQAGLRPKMDWLSEEMEMPLEEAQMPVTDNNVLKEPKKQDGKPLKDQNKKRENNPKKIEGGEE